MSRTAEPYAIHRRNDSKTYQLTLRPSCGLSQRVCSEWRRRSFSNFPEELAHHRYPKSKPEAKIGAQALINFLIKKSKEGSVRRIITEDITVNAWIEKFTKIETSPRAGLNMSKNRPLSYNTVDAYKSFYNCHIKDDPFAKLKMAEVEEEDILEYMARLSVKELNDKRKIGGSRTFAAILSFIRMTFNNYSRKNKSQMNPFQYIDPPSSNKKSWDALPEDEMIRLFMPGVLSDTMELAVCAIMFLSGLRRGEIAALKPEDLDWNTPKITVCRNWQRFNKKDKVLGPPKGKKDRFAPFDPILQAAIKKLWEENGRHEFVFSFKKKRNEEKAAILGSKWIQDRFYKWLKLAGIELGGRRIVPHSSRHSLASLLEEKGVSLRYIQELLGHSDLKTTKIYLHSTEKTIRDIGRKITEARKNENTLQIDENKIAVTMSNIIDFKVS